MKLTAPLTSTVVDGQVWYQVERENSVLYLDNEREDYIDIYIILTCTY